MRYQTPQESYQDYVRMQAFRPQMRVKPFDEYWAGRVAAMKLFEEMRPQIKANRTRKRKRAN